MCRICLYRLYKSDEVTDSYIIQQKVLAYTHVQFSLNSYVVYCIIVLVFKYRNYHIMYMYMFTQTIVVLIQMCAYKYECSTPIVYFTALEFICGWILNMFFVHFEYCLFVFCCAENFNKILFTCFMSKFKYIASTHTCMCICVRVAIVSI